MIYTIGFDTVEGAEPVTKETNISNINPENIIVVNASGSNREQWEKIKPFPPAFKFKGLLPTCEQKEQIYDFIQNGGTVISTLPDPDEVIETIMLQEEIDSQNKEDFSSKNDDGTTVKCTYSPFDWLLDEMNGLAKTAYNCKKSEYNRESSVYIESTVETIAFFIGDLGGRVIFTKRLNNNYPINMQDLQEITNSCIKKDESNVTKK
ncbi:hypothetical protein [Bacillus tropicus]|uniref:hypothetical protein n=1 Tax=Bacillus tropicus TaxID=2026188 RepID=UPI002DB70EA0|nr:hypothetical protein [Bacillus tropicus]MEC2921435.1 hypothetical protein [Bacillus tropicus]MEC2926536.1 hypothetical protein [Bacillus tropicus]MEC2956129.1 hypothetical protein [Bacillus tropicus]MEC3051570.1 hypothetical protein [Bacillus tropicus]MEC3078005.1 hypothetical protein [Bacillus tropicus]